MASSSSSHKQIEAHSVSEPRSRRKVEESVRLFDVFINHRGPDVKETLALQLYKSLEKLGIRAFLDSEEKQPGVSFSATIKTAIQSARVHIAIFSKGYAESPWCLDELVLMLETEAKIIPLFYEVEPSDLRHIEKGVYDYAFKRYEKKSRYLPKLKEWKGALDRISYVAGYVIKELPAAMECKEIVSDVQKEMQRMKFLHVAEYPVGLSELVQEFESRCLSDLLQDFESRCLSDLLQDFESLYGINEDGQRKSRIVGIYGMGGTGKTTLSKELFNKYCSKYTRASFLFDVRQASSRSALPSLQLQLLKDLFDEELPSFTSTGQGISYLKNRLGRIKYVNFLIVLDDIDDLNQLDDLLVTDMLEKSGNSLIIVTTRDAGVLRRAGIPCYNLEELNEQDARELFCLHAFRETNPPREYESLVEAFVKECGRVPLCLQVLGSHVKGQDQSYWISVLRKVRKTLPNQIKEKLKISFDSLDTEEKQIFIDIACFFIGSSKNMAIKIWEGSGWDAHRALETLKEKCLVQEIEKKHLDGLEWEWDDINLGMHDHLRDLGREMADLYRAPRRIWKQENLKSLESMAGFRNIIEKTRSRCFYSLFDTSVGSKITFFLAGKLASLLWLQLDLKSLVHPSIPSWIPLQKLQCLRISDGRLERLWESHHQPPLQLRELRINRCFQGSSLPEEFCALQSLEHLELTCCSMLSSLPPRFGDLRNLQYLDLSDCEQLEELPHSFEQLTCLTYIRLSCCWKLKLRLDMLKNITKLEHLDLTRCPELEELPHQISNQASLERLFVVGTSIKGEPTNIGEVRRLEELRVGSPMLTSLPSSLGNLSCLRNLLIDGCPRLEYLPQSLCHLNLLKQVGIRASGLKKLPFRAGSSNFEVTGQEPSNPGFNFRPRITENCFQSIWNAIKRIAENYLKTIWNAFRTRWIKRRITEHGSLQRDFPNKLPAGIETLSLVANPQLMEIPVLPQSLKILEICACKMLKNISGIGSLVKLRRLEIRSCPELDVLPSFADLVSLQEFKFQGCPKVEIIQGLEQCSSLQSLTAEVPNVQRLENVEGLRRVDLACEKISALKPCILSMKECPREMMIRGRITHFVEPIVDSLSLMNLYVLRLEKDSDWDNIPRHIFNEALLWYEEEKESNDEESGSSGVRVAVCREGSPAFQELDSNPNFRLFAERRFGSNPNFRKRKAMLATGEDRRVVAAFHELIALLE